MASRFAVLARSQDGFFYSEVRMTVQAELIWLRILVQIWREQVAIDREREVACK